MLLSVGAGAQSTVAGLTATQLKTFQSLNNVENTAVSTWGGSSNIVTLGTIATGVWQGTAIAGGYGGTGLTTYAVGDIMYASASTTLSKLADVATGNALISGGITTAPSWGKIGLTTHVSGTLAVGNGGLGFAACATGDLIVGSGSNTFAVVNIGSANKVLTSDGTTAAWANPTSGVTTVITADQSAAVNNIYVNNKASTQCVVTLPSTAAVGTIIEVDGLNVNGWKVAQNASQKIHAGGTTTTTGTGGYISSNEQWDAVMLRCVVANLEWDVVYSTGTITAN